MNLIQEAEEWIKTSRITPRSMSSRRAAQLLTSCISRITKLETALSGRTHHHSDSDIERELNEAEDRIIELEQRLASKEDALAASEARVAELDRRLSRINQHPSLRERAQNEQAFFALRDMLERTKSDARQLAEAVIEDHGDYAERDSSGMITLCQCPACQTARRVLA